MMKRGLAALLWFLAVAYLWNLVATVTGVTTVPSVLAGLAAAMLVAGDPMHRIWRTPGA